MSHFRVSAPYSFSIGLPSARVPYCTWTDPQPPKVSYRYYRGESISPLAHLLQHFTPPSQFPIYCSIPTVPQRDSSNQPVYQYRFTYPSMSLPLEEIRGHPAWSTVIEVQTPNRQGAAPVAKKRPGGPIN